MGRGGRRVDIGFYVETDFSKCTVKDDPRLEDGTCHNFEPFHTEECHYDGGDCTNTEEQTSAISPNHTCTIHSY